jgi:hypothetical protein
MPMWPLFAGALERPKRLRIGTLSLNRRTSAQRVAFEQRLRELGYIEGQNLVIEYINAPDRPDRLDEAAGNWFNAMWTSLSWKITSPLNRASSGQISGLEYWVRTGPVGRRTRLPLWSLP